MICNYKLLHLQIKNTERKQFENVNFACVNQCRFTFREPDKNPVNFQFYFVNPTLCIFKRVDIRKIQICIVGCNSIKKRINSGCGMCC